jgi:hypothetical protein
VSLSIGASSDPTPLKPGNAGGGKGPQFKTDALRGEGSGDWPSAAFEHQSELIGCRTSHLILFGGFGRFTNTEDYKFMFSEEAILKTVKYWGTGAFIKRP